MKPLHSICGPGTDDILLHNVKEWGLYLYDYFHVQGYHIPGDISSQTLVRLLGVKQSKYSETSAPGLNLNVYNVKL